MLKTTHQSKELLVLGLILLAVFIKTVLKFAKTENTDTNFRSNLGLQKSLFLHHIHRQAFLCDADNRALTTSLNQYCSVELFIEKSRLLALL
jgi:hypothetical protein